jgi:glucose/arabinose dehydrogenase
VRARAVAAGTALLLGSVLLVACGGGSGGSDGASTSPSGTQVGPGAKETTTSEATTSGTGGDTTTTPEGPGKVEGVEVASVAEPTMLLPRPGDAGHVYVAERAGTVRRLAVGDDGTLEPVGDVLLDISDDTSTESERGLLGLAFSEDGDEIYVSSTDGDGNTRVASYAMDGDDIDDDSAEVILAQEQPFPNHNGGHVLLGPDGKLWFGFGDGGSGDDPKNNAQNPETVLGKLVRFTPGDEPEIVAAGLRNPWRFSFDTDCSLWIADVGQNQWEEIDRVDAEDIEGANFGWSGYEGTHEYLDFGRRPDDAIAPIFEYSHDSGNCSVTGGFVYRGKALPSLRGAYLFADYCAGEVRAITVDSKGRFARELDLDVQVENPVSFGTDEDGEAYVLSQSGAIVRLAPA